jgi:hypothetical protein
MTQPNDSPPYAAAHAAAFSEVDEKTYALIGEIVPSIDPSGATTYHLLVGQGVGKPIDDEYLPVYEFFSTPRSEHQAREWLEWAGAPTGFLEFLVKLEFLARVDTRTSTRAAKSLRGMRLQPKSSPGEPSDDGFVAVISEGSQRPGMYVCHELAAVLWGNEDGVDIPTMVKRIAKATGQGREQAARKVVAMMPMLLEYGYARLEWVRVPNA